MQDIAGFVTAARKKGRTNAEIRDLLVDAGWAESNVAQALAAADGLNLPIPTVTSNPQSVGRESGNTTIRVVNNGEKGRHGLEYIIMFIALWFSAISLAILLDANVSQLLLSERVDSSFPSAALLVTFPIFIWLFILTQRMEQKNPLVRRDSSRLGALNITLVVTFAITIIHLITTIAVLFSGQNSQPNSAFAQILYTLITLLIAGPIFAYWWIQRRKDVELMETQPEKNETA